MQPWRFFTKADHDFMARTVYRLTQKSLLYQAGTRRKLLMDTGASLTGDTVFCFFQKCDQGGAAGLGLGELHRGLDLGQHGALGELVLVHIDLGLGGGQIIQTLLVGLIEVDGHLFHGGEDHKNIGVQQLRQQLAAEVLVDDGGGAAQLCM